MHSVILQYNFCLTMIPQKRVTEMPEEAKTAGISLTMSRLMNLSTALIFLLALWHEIEKSSLRNLVGELPVSQVALSVLKLCAITVIFQLGVDRKSWGVFILCSASFLKSWRNTYIGVAKRLCWHTVRLNPRKRNWAPFPKEMSIH